MRPHRRRNIVKHPALLAAVAALAVLAALIINPGIVSDQTPNDSAPRLVLALTAEARQSLQSATSAFPKTEAGFSAYYRVSNKPDNYTLDKDLVDQTLHQKNSSTSLRAGVAVLQEMSGSHTVTSVPIKNIHHVEKNAADLATPVNVYYDDQGWVVAYLPKATPSSQVWQARNVDSDQPMLADLSNTVLLDAINAVVNEVLKRDAVSVDNTALGYYHWAYPEATKFLLMASARGLVDGEDTFSFAVPSTFTIYEAAASWWAVVSTQSTDKPCAAVTLDGKALSNTPLCAPGWQHHRVNNLTAFQQTSGHNVTLEQSVTDDGATGVLMMLVYSPP